MKEALSPIRRLDFIAAGTVAVGLVLGGCASEARESGNQETTSTTDTLHKPSTSTNGSVVVEVCDIESKRIITLPEKDFSPDSYSRNFMDCAIGAEGLNKSILLGQDNASQ